MHNDDDYDFDDDNSPPLSPPYGSPPLSPPLYESPPLSPPYGSPPISPPLYESPPISPQASLCSCPGCELRRDIDKNNLCPSGMHHWGTTCMCSAGNTECQGRNWREKAAAEERHQQELWRQQELREQQELRQQQERAHQEKIHKDRLRRERELRAQQELREQREHQEKMNRERLRREAELRHQQELKEHQEKLHRERLEREKELIKQEELKRKLEQLHAQQRREEESRYRKESELASKAKQKMDLADTEGKKGDFETAIDNYGIAKGLFQELINLSSNNSNKSYYESEKSKVINNIELCKKFIKYELFIKDLERNFHADNNFERTKNEYSKVINYLLGQQQDVLIDADYKKLLQLKIISAKNRLAEIENLEQVAIKSTEGSKFAESAKKSLSEVEKKSYYEKALDKFEEAIRLSPNDKVLHSNKAAMLINLKNYPDAIKAAEKAISFDETYERAKKQKKEAFNRMGEILLEQCEYPEAIRHYTKAIEYDSENGLNYYHKANALFLVGRNEDVQKKEDILQLISKALILNSKYSPQGFPIVKALTLKGKILRDLGKYDLGINTIKDALPLCNSENAEALQVLLADIYYKKGSSQFVQSKFKEALDNFSLAIQCDGNFEYYCSKALTLNKLKQYEEAIVAAEKALELNRDSMKIKEALSCAYLDLGVKLFRETEGLGETTRFLQEKKDKYQKALDNFYNAKRYIHDDSSNYYRLYVSLAMVCNKLDYSDEAIAAARQAIENAKRLRINYDSAQTELNTANSKKLLIILAAANPDPTLPPNVIWQELQIGSVIGHGSFGDVYAGIYNNFPVAIKLLHLKSLPGNSQLSEDFYKEVRIMKECQSENIIQLHGICTEPGHLSIIMEYMSGGSLNSLLHNNQEELTENQKWQLAIDIASGLTYLHAEKNIVHGDLKSNNILLDSSKNHAKITDFGLSGLRLETSSSNTLSSGRAAGTVRWKAPELFARRVGASKASDVYSYGMILWEIITRKIPFSEQYNEQIVIDWIRSGEKETIPDNCPQVWREIINSCWSSAAQRPTISDILNTLIQNKPRTPSTNILPQFSNLNLSSGGNNVTPSVSQEATAAHRNTNRNVLNNR